MVYIDPPYTVAHNNNGFIKYSSRLFEWQDQLRLALSAREAASRGAMVLVSNAAHQSVAELYPGFAATVIERQSVVGSLAKYRKPTEELLLCSRVEGLNVDTGQCFRAL